MSSCQTQKTEPVAQARAWADRLVRGEAVRSGLPVRDAARLVARRLRTSASALLALIYAPRKDIGANLYNALAEAVGREMRQDIHDLEKELARARLLGGSAHPGEIQEIEAGLAALRARLTAIGEASS